MDAYSIKPFLFALTLFCILSWTCHASTTAVNLPPTSSSSSSALLAAEILRGRGYSLFASTILSLSLVSANFSGTVLAPPDFTFSSTTSMFLNNRHPTPRPSVTLLLYHTLKPPLILTWTGLWSRDDGDELRTLYNNNCLYVFRNPYDGDVMIASSSFKNPLNTVQIRQPDLYVDEHLIVHGIDGVLDPSYATKCSGPATFGHPPVQEAPLLRVNRTYLDHAMRALRRTGYSVVAAAMAVRRMEMLSLTEVTVFAVSDRNFFLKQDGFLFDFRHHVVPTRLRIEDLTVRTELATLAPEKIIVVDSVDGFMAVDGIAVGGKEVYRSTWIGVLSIVMSLDDVTEPRNLTVTDQVSDESAHSPPPIAGVSNVPSPAPSYLISSPVPENSWTGSRDLSSIGTHPVSEFYGGIAGEAPDSDAASGPMPAPHSLVSFPAPSPAEVGGRCVMGIGDEGGDLFCPEGTTMRVRRLQETEDLRSEHVEGSQPSNGTEDLTQIDDAKLVDNVNIADDIFFYT